MKNKVLLATTLGLGLMLTIGTLINPNAYAQQNHPVVGSTFDIAAAQSKSIPFSIPSGVTNAYLSGTVLITGGILSTIDFSLVNTDTGAVLIDRQKYTDQGNIGIYIPAGC
jgi:hypothetical protein